MKGRLWVSREGGGEGDGGEAELFFQPLKHSSTFCDITLFCEDGSTEEPCELFSGRVPWLLGCGNLLLTL